MAYNKYNTRQSGRYNTPGRFVSAGQLSGPPQVKTFNIQEDKQPQQKMTFNNVVGQPPQPPQPPLPYNNGDFKEENDEQFDTSENMDISNNDNMDESSQDPSSQKPHWMKPKLQGVRKISNKERRRRQNGSLRRLLSPKNALMVLNEIDKGELNYVVEPVNNQGQFFKQNSASTFCAALTASGKSYKGYGENKMAARNAAAEQAVRDLLIKKMNTILNTESEPTPNDGNEQAEPEEDLPMIQLASFALHKLFAEWECQGYRVPQLRAGPQVSDTASETGSTASAGPKPPKVPRTEVPAAAATMHPCMLLSHMRPGLTYREAAVEGDKPLNILFTMEVEVDGKVFTGKACNKREARKAAARDACQAIFGVQFTE